ncbi:SSF1 protein, partial [Nyctibius bracteatus]|nr:SSF1 protein [Nyctibius bracteatus]
QVNLNSIKRCLLIAYNTETQLLEFRHYSLKVVPVGVSKGLKKLLQEKFPNMSRLEDISELLVKDINLSESEAEQDGTHNVLELPQAYAGRGNMKAQQSAVRLTEIGPRMTLQLIKVEEGLAQGNVLYHSFVHKAEAEVKEILARKEAKLQLKAERRQKQEEDVERKRRQREAHRWWQGGSGSDLFPDRTKRKRSSSGAAPLRKRRRHRGPAAPDPAAPGKRPKGAPAPRDSRHRGGATQGAGGRKRHRGGTHPPREGAGSGSGRASARPKGRGTLLAKGKTIFRRPGRATKGKR